MEKKDVAIEARDIVKVYKLYDKLRDRMFDALGIGKKKYKLYEGEHIQSFSDLTQTVRYIRP